MKKARLRARSDREIETHEVESAGSSLSEGLLHGGLGGDSVVVRRGVVVVVGVGRSDRARCGPRGEGVGKERKAARRSVSGPLDAITTTIREIERVMLQLTEHELEP